MAGCILTGIALFAWSVLLDVRYGFDDRLAARWVRLTGRLGRGAAPVSFAIALAALVGFAVLAGIGAGLGGSWGDPLWSLLVTGPAALAYTPFVMATMPSAGGSYASWRGSLAAAGAAPGLQRAIAWSAGPPSLVGLVTLIAVCYSIFIG